MSAQTDQTQVQAQLISDFTKLFFKGYGAIYVVLIVLFAISAIGSGTMVKPEAWLKQAFPGATAKMNQQQLQQIINVDAAAIRVKSNYTFKASGGAEVTLTSGETANELVSVEMAQSLLRGDFPYAGQEMKIFKEGWFWRIGWGGVFTVYNLLGMFCALYLLLKTPIAKMLDEAAATTAKDLQEAEKARNFADELARRSEKIEQELAQEKQRLENTLREEEDAERERIMGLAKHEAGAIVESVKVSVDAEVSAAVGRLRQKISKEALIKAAAVLASDTTNDDHESAINSFIADLKQVEK